MKRKLAGFGLAFAVAELALAYLPPLAVMLTAAFAILAAAVRAARCRRWPAYLPVWLGLACGLAWFLVYQAAVVAPRLKLAGQTVQAVAVVQTDAEPAFEEGMLRGTLQLVSLDGKPANLRVYCMNFPGVAPGERFSATFALDEQPKNAYRMAQYARGNYLRAEYLEGYAPGTPSDAPAFWLYRLRQALSRRLRLYLPRDLGGIEAAMLLGDCTQLAQSVENRFRMAGVSHLLSISGLHFSMLCGLFLLGPGAQRRRYCRPFLAAQAAVLLFYMALTGFPVSVVRAGVIYLVALLGYALVQPSDLLTSLGIAALAIGFQNGYAPCDLGCQLSFCGVIGVQLGAALGRWQRSKLLPEDARRDARGQSRPQTLPQRVLDLLLMLAEGVETALLASCATLPSLLAHGLTASGVSVLANLLVVWMLSPALVLGLLVLAFSALPWLYPCMRMASLLLSVWLRWMDSLIGWCAELPVASVYLPRRYTLLVIAILAALAYLFWVRRRMVFYLPAGVFCLAVAVGLGAAGQRNVVRAVLVGTAGNACTVVTQNGQALVFFRGGASNLQAVEEYFAENGEPDWVATVDLRQDPTVLAFPSETCYALDALPPGSAALTLPGGWTLDCVRTGGGNLAVLDVAGYHIAFGAGRVALAEPVEVDLYCAGGTVPADIQPRVIVSNAAGVTAEKLAAAAPADAKLYTGETPAVVIRPGRSVIFEEVEPLAVQ